MQWVERAKAQLEKRLPINAEPVRRAIILGVPAAVATVAVANSLPVESIKPMVQEASLGVGAVEQNLNIVGKNLFALVTRLRQDPRAKVNHSHIDTLEIPERGTTVEINQKGRRKDKDNYYTIVTINQTQIVGDNKKRTTISFTYDPTQPNPYDS